MQSLMLQFKRDYSLLINLTRRMYFLVAFLEIEGLGDLKVEQAFELADATAERSANGCTVQA